MSVIDRRALVAAARTFLIACTLGLISPSSTWALSVERCISQDNHVYVIDHEQPADATVAITNMNPTPAISEPGECSGRLG
jgi:hypothetical protein